jgi:hypothetical protein
MFGSGGRGRSILGICTGENGVTGVSGAVVDVEFMMLRLWGKELFRLEVTDFRLALDSRVFINGFVPWSLDRNLLKRPIRGDRVRFQVGGEVLEHDTSEQYPPANDLSLQHIHCGVFDAARIAHHSSSTRRSG